MNQVEPLRRASVVERPRVAVVAARAATFPEAAIPTDDRAITFPAGHISYWRMVVSPVLGLTDCLFSASVVPATALPPAQPPRVSGSTTTDTR